MSKNHLRAFAPIVAASLVLIAPQIASARPIRIDFGDNFDLTGANWDGSFDDAIDVVDDGTSGGLLPFDLLVGTTTYDSYCVAENAVIWLASGGADACAADPTSDPLLAVFSLLDADWVSIYDDDPTFPTQATDDGAVSASFDGFVDRDLDGDGLYELADGLDAVRFHWNAVTLAGDPTVFYSFQALFFDLGGGDFDVEFNYGFGDSDAYNGIQSISEGGANLVTGTGPFGPGTDYTFSFRGGQLGTAPPPTTVPEPGVLWLLITGLGGLAWTARRRPRRT